MALELDGGSTNPSKLHLPSDRCAGFVGVFVHVFMCVCVCVFANLSNGKGARSNGSNKPGWARRPSGLEIFTWFHVVATMRGAA